MVTAQVLEATHTVDIKVARVEDGVVGVDNKMKVVDDKVTVVIDGA